MKKTSETQNQAAPTTKAEPKQVTLKLKPELFDQLLDEVTKQVQPLIELREAVRVRIEAKSKGMDRVRKTIAKKETLSESLKNEIQELLSLGQDASKKMLEKAALDSEVKTLREVMENTPDGTEVDREQLEEIETRVSRAISSALRASSVHQEQEKRLLGVLLEAVDILEEWKGDCFATYEKLNTRPDMGEVPLRMPEVGPEAVRLREIRDYAGRI